MFHQCDSEFSLQIVRFLSRSTFLSSTFPNDQTAFKWQLVACGRHVHLSLLSAPLATIKIISVYSSNCHSLIRCADIKWEGKTVSTTFVYLQCDNPTSPNLYSSSVPENACLKYSGSDSSVLIKVNIIAIVLPSDVKDTNQTWDQYSTKLLSSMFKDTEFKDLIIQTESSKFNVHKSVFAAISPVFRASLQHNMKEKDSNCIVIKGYEDDVIEQMIFFIYHGHLIKNDNYKILSELLKISDMYDIKNLKDYSSKHIQNLIEKDNVLHVLLLADLCNDSELKNLAVNYFVQNMKIYSSDEFKEIMELRPQLLPELISRMSENQSNSDNEEEPQCPMPKRHRPN